MKTLLNLLVQTVATYLLGATVAAHSAEQRVICPQRLEPDTIQPNHPPAGWELHMPRGVYLTEGGMLHGPPDESAYLVPDDSTSRKTGKQSVRTQHWALDVPHGYTTWMYCGYGGAGAPLKLFKRVIEGATECSMSSKTSDGRVQDLVEFVCK